LYLSLYLQVGGNDVARQLNDRSSTSEMGPNQEPRFVLSAALKSWKWAATMMTMMSGLELEQVANNLAVAAQQVEDLGLGLVYPPASDDVVSLKAATKMTPVGEDDDAVRWP
jgi:hypothetical protein